MAKKAPFLPGLLPAMGKPVHLDFDGGQLTSDAGILLLAEIERRLGIAERLADCLNDPRSPGRIRSRETAMSADSSESCIASQTFSTWKCG